MTRERDSMYFFPQAIFILFQTQMNMAFGQM
jgi:hypothetical protein